MGNISSIVPQPCDIPNSANVTTYNQAPIVSRTQVATAGNGNDSYTKLLLHGSKNFTDYSFGKSETHTATLGNSVAISMEQYKFLPGSMKFSTSTNDYVTFPDSEDWNFASSDCCIDFWVRFDELLSNSQLLGQDGGTGSWFIYTYSDGQLAVGINGTSQLATSGGTLTTGTWTHCIIEKISGTTAIWVNGSKITSGGGTYFNSTSSVLRIGSTTSGNSLRGYMQELRITKGKGRTNDSTDKLYSSNGTTYTIPTTEYGNTNDTWTFANSTPSTSPIESTDKIQMISSDAVLHTHGQVVGTTGLNPQTDTTYTLALTDQGKLVTMSNVSANTITIPANSSESFPVGAWVDILMGNYGVTTITADTGVTLNDVSAGTKKSCQNEIVRIIQTDTDDWVCDLGGGIVPNEQTGTSYTLSLADRNKIVTMSNTSANSLYVPVNSSVPLPIGYVVAIQMKGTGITTIDGSSSITINGASGGNCNMDQWQIITLIKTDIDTWSAAGGTFTA